MRGLFGVVSLLVVLAIAGVVAMKQLRPAKAPFGTSIPAAQTGADSATAVAAASSVRISSRQLQERIADDTRKALEQGAQRNQDADK